MKDRATLFLIAVPVILWGLFGFLGTRVASNISSRYGARILAVGDGKFAEVQPFVEGRLKDAALLATAACLLILVHRVIAASAARRLQAPVRWIVQGWSVFICLNVFAAIAARTVLFWCLLYTGKDHINNDTQWHIKETLLTESSAPSQAVLLGSSQTRTEIDSNVLNQRLGRSIWTTELHFPGSSLYDMVLCLERLPKARVDYVITYLSEGNFYLGSGSERLMYFFGLRDLPAYWTLGPGKPAFDRYMVCGLLGDIFPAYQVWEPIDDRLQIWPAENATQQRYDASLDSDLVKRAQLTAGRMSLGPDASFQKKAFVAFAKMCRQRGCRLIVCCGQLNPILERAIDPALRRDMVAFLRDQAVTDPNITLLDESHLPPQVEADYDDLTHVNAAARARFSQYLADILEKLARSKHS